MTDQQPTIPTPPAPPAEPGPSAAPSEGKADDGDRYAAYDHTLQRFISGVGTKADAAKAAKAGPKGHKITPRKV